LKPKKREKKSLGRHQKSTKGRHQKKLSIMEDEVLERMKSLADRTRKETTLVKLPPGYENHPPVNYQAANGSYGFYYMGDLIPTWPDVKCDGFSTNEPCHVVTNCHHIWDSKRKKWRMACVDHFDQFMTSK